MNAKRAMAIKRFKDCKTAQEIVDFFDNDEQGFHHTKYYHYTTFEKACKILKNGIWRLSSLAREDSNDCVERDLQRQEGKTTFSICFSTGTSESLPLWYLYSGVDGGGVRFEFSKAQIKKIMNTKTMQLVVAKKDQRGANIAPIPLNQEDGTWMLRDIMYIGKDTVRTGKYRIKHNNEALNGVVDETMYCELRERYSAYEKGLIWFYEKETRLRYEITNVNIAKKIADSGLEYVLELPLDSIQQDFQFRLGPQIEQVDNESIAEQDETVRNILIKKAKLSDYSGQIDMGLKGMCSACKKGNGENMDQERERIK